MIKKISFRNLIISLIIVISAVLYVRYVWVKTEDEQSEKIMQIARSVAASLPTENLKVPYTTLTSTTNYFETFKGTDGKTTVDFAPENL